MAVRFVAFSLYECAKVRKPHSQECLCYFLSASKSMLDTEIKVTPELAAEHGLTAEEYARIQKILGRDPNFTELGIFSVMWSEHCSYKSSKVHLRRLPTRGPQVCKAPAKMRAWWISATDWPPRSRWSRTIIRATSSRFRARRRASAGSCATFSRWARGRLPCSIRCASGQSLPELQGLKP